MKKNEIKLSIRQLQVILRFFATLENSGQVIPNKLWYAIAKNKSKITRILDPAVEANNALVRQYGTDDENGNTVVLPNNENYEKWRSESKELEDTIESIDPYKIAYEELDKINGLKAIPGILDFYDHFVEEPEEEPNPNPVEK